MQPRNEEAEFLAGAQLHPDPDDGIDCGACVPACPVSAIYPSEDLPERGKKFAAINAEWSAAKTTGWLGASASLANLAGGESA